ncbi:MAG: sterol desaturase family protein [Desulfocapsaceae bacterium]|nr:sterol desaturase family protein [Desulfocapsaceae bacterium]
MEAEKIIRFSTFLGILMVLAIMETLTPRREKTVPKAQRWFINLTLVALNPLSVALVFPLLPMGMAQLAAEHNWGLLNHSALPFWLKIISGIVMLDLVLYTQHVLSHAIPAFWRLHRVHHADLDFDLTTGLRFHPLEIVISMLVKLAAVAAIGPPPLAVLLFEIVLNATSMFNHSNIEIPQKIDLILRMLAVTPDMHRVHHSVIIRETNSNFGFNLPWWDRLFGTYKDQPANGHTEMLIGLAQYRDQRKLSLIRLLIMPFVGDSGVVPINRH